MPFNPQRDFAKRQDAANSAYRRLAKKLHPDAGGSDDAMATTNAPSVPIRLSLNLQMTTRR
jgi:hypothetical protein